MSIKYSGSPAAEFKAVSKNHYAGDKILDQLILWHYQRTGFYPEFPYSTPVVKPNEKGGWDILSTSWEQIDDARITKGRRTVKNFCAQKGYVNIMPVHPLQTLAQEEPVPLKYPLTRQNIREMVELHLQQEGFEPGPDSTTPVWIVDQSGDLVKAAADWAQMHKISYELDAAETGRKDLLSLQTQLTTGNLIRISPQIRVP